MQPHNKTRNSERCRIPRRAASHIDPMLPAFPSPAFLSLSIASAQSVRKSRYNRGQASATLKRSPAPKERRRLGMGKACRDKRHHSRARLVMPLEDGEQACWDWGESPGRVGVSRVCTPHLVLSYSPQLQTHATQRRSERCGSSGKLRG